MREYTILALMVASIPASTLGQARIKEGSRPQRKVCDKCVYGARSPFRSVWLYTERE
jgi:hypothetical protein